MSDLIVRAEKEPFAEKMLSDDGAEVTPWAQVRERLVDGGSLQENARWLATVRPDGRPHVVPLWPVWLDGALYFTTGQGTRKEKNLAHNTHCTITTAVRGIDIVVEGVAAKVGDEAKLERVAEIYRSHGWPVTVRDGAFDAPEGAPTTGPAPYEVYEITPMIAFALPSEDPRVYPPTRYRF
jgi:nitroimidazol reductase NimA-like FMN-containing flavoprotein (pyridoxamine 5'-phosphate oxidase superfamily)